MFPLDQIEIIAHSSPSKIVQVVMDGLGGLPHSQTGMTELETAHTPNLDALAAGGTCGLLHPVAPGITTGSVPGHLALFGYDPVQNHVGRGVVEALGIDFALQPGDVAARGNFCSIDDKGLLSDRRAGRIPTEESARLCQLLSSIDLSDIVPGTQVFVKPVREHRFALILRAEGLGDDVADTDPQKEGLAPLPAVAGSSGSDRTAGLANSFVEAAHEILSSQIPANMVLLRGFSGLPHMPPMSQVFRLNPAAIAALPMYLGLAKVVGMTVFPAASSIEEEFRILADSFAQYDYFFLHLKPTDLAGEDGDFDRKVKVIEEVDSLIPHILELNPHVLAVTADHSTPATYKSHSWHPVPLLLSSSWCRRDGVSAFSETQCLKGGLGHMASVQVMPLLLAHAGKLSKFGA
ncbi:MAG: 2,3-bisphosphoglycerate-independent phosphoglycerate mutase [Dehalococcoidia bacterium]|nr:2,3-bisphosphoglycerate-independent phosphoglycerate mutase [Dehalococcoidia bacterium]MDP7469403.1 2,3-bisphosphoglycerate-independent phosphoglycerate mutase [Dehalococcoidia bacterium]